MDACALDSVVQKFVKGTFDRLQEHMRATRDFQLLKGNRRSRVPLYESILKYGFGGIQMTFPEKVSSFAADAREIYWMHRFGLSNLLDRSLTYVNPNETGKRV